MKNLNRITSFLLKNIRTIINKENESIKEKIFYKTKKKDLTDPVTKFDLSIEKKIRNEIIKKFPTHSIIGEEFKNLINKSDYEWYIDPIDGTKALIAGQPTWSNLIGLFYKKKPCISLANFPALGKYYYSDGKKSFVCLKNKKKIIRSSSNTSLEKSYLITNSIHTFKNQQIYKFFKNYKYLFKITGSDSYNFCLLSEGKIDILIESGLKIYDIAPMLPLIFHSGAVISDWSGGQDYLKGEIIVASNKILHKKFLNFFLKNTKK